MSGNLAPLPIWQFLDQNGHPISGGSVQWYRAGTQTPVTVFADVGLTVPLPNPVPLDSAGRPRTASGPTAIWLDPARAYKQILKDDTGRVIWTADDIVSPGTGSPGPPGPPGATGGTIDANYTEGTFTPVLKSSGAAGSPTGESGQTYEAQVGFWARIGNVVWVSGWLRLSARGTWPAGAQVMIDGLPFVPRAVGNTGSIGTATIAVWSGLVNPWSNLQGVVIDTPPGIAIFGFPTHYSENPYDSPLTETNLTDTSDFRFAGSYLTEGEPAGAIRVADEILLGDGADTITLDPKYTLHLAHCQNYNAPIALTTVTGSQPPRVGERLIILSSGQPVFLVGGVGGPESFINDVGSGATPLYGGVAEYVHSSVWAGWRLVSHRQDLPITTPFTGGWYAARPGFGTTWMVNSNNMVAQQYELVGTRIRLWLELSGTTFTGTGGDLLINQGVWGGYTARLSTQMAGMAIVSQDLEYNICWVTAFEDGVSLRIANLTGTFHDSVLGLNMVVEFEVE